VVKIHLANIINFFHVLLPILSIFQPKISISYIIKFSLDKIFDLMKILTPYMI